MRHFDPNQFIIKIMGIDLTEYAQGEFLSLTPQNPSWSVQQGYNGASIRTKMPDGLYDGKLVLTRGSPDNAAIQDAVILDQNSGTGSGALLIKDLNGNTLISAQVSFFQPNEMKFDSDGSPVEWSFVAEIRAENRYQGSNRYV